LVNAAVEWERLVVSPEAESQLRDAVTRWNYQSQVLEDWQLRLEARANPGIRLMLTGGPGTGKSTTSEVLATALGTDLLVVDISRIVSKWIGETEKNLERVFDVAERTQAVLMLDEADALFGTRTEISDAHDRYANLETAYLLQRLDHFDGIAVLATNLKHNIDPAFLRRMDFVIEFDLPDVPSRRTLWSLHMPAKLRADDLDLDELAWRFPVPGGWIRNAAIGAAFLAVPAGGPVTRDHVLAALRREYAKAAMPFPDITEARQTPDPSALRAIELVVRKQRQIKERS
jgi:SpoVK/Ycf46/Vps4 family AAA+-type ATPase